MAKAPTEMFPVHCRTGSLENGAILVQAWCNVHCRTGSLETVDGLFMPRNLVHCRTGSLESSGRLNHGFCIVHCRTGSLETFVRLVPAVTVSSLPHRQLRNANEKSWANAIAFTAAQAA